MAVEAKDVAPYFANPVTRDILGILVGKDQPLSKIVNKVGQPNEEVAAWLHEMKARGVVSHSIKPPNSKVEATFSLTPQARKAFTALYQPFVRGRE